MSRREYEIGPEELRARLEGADPPVLLDVRRPDEVAICSLPGSLHLPMDELEERLDELATEKDTVIVCHHGVRSLSAAAFLRNRGFSSVWSLAGGIDRWSLVIDPKVPRY
jgi:rhodanese-related sulfurtransferase